MHIQQNLSSPFYTPNLNLASGYCSVAGVKKPFKARTKQIRNAQMRPKIGGVRRVEGPDFRNSVVLKTRHYYVRNKFYFH